ncbi:hypothetical protein [Streptomyces sp. NPDC047079]|uniref:hypothetical protein n=1 Tax=Streptomyces sp. NPDC047079 TaxID=3154607 RepID=UPI0033FEAD21
MHHSTHTASVASAAAMAWSGFVLAAVIPGALWRVRRAPLWDRVSLPAGVALPLLVLTHAWAVLGDPVRLAPPGATFLTEPLLVAAAVVFWLPVLAHTRHRLSDPGRCLYLFLAAPLLDLPAVGVIAAGHSLEGLAMIVGMLPVGAVAAGVTWSWVNREERLAAHALVRPAGEGDLSAP